MDDKATNTNAQDITILQSLLLVIGINIIAFPLALRFLGLWLRRHTTIRTKIIRNLAGKSGSKNAILVGFFHPFCNAGGGGERVLWAAVRSTLNSNPNTTCIIYTADTGHLKREQVIATVHRRFNISLDSARVIFVHLVLGNVVLPEFYPHFTLLGQSIGSLALGMEAFTKVVPDVFVDTMGYGFVLGMARAIFGRKMVTGAYVHYPTISTDMLGSIKVQSGWKGWAKGIYWRAFAVAYGLCGLGVDVVMANSSWTSDHIQKLWWGHSKKKGQSGVEVVFPPCNVEEIVEKVKLEKKREKIILCIAQFRPEKNHELIIRAFARFMETAEPETRKDAKLVLVGSVRGEEDLGRVKKLRGLAESLDIVDDVEFVCDSTWGEILEWLGKSWIGTNAMWNEHFGIGVVEYQAAGLIGVVHNSGGPKLDIVVEYDGGLTGFHATTIEEFADGFEKALSLPENEVVAIRRRAQSSSKRFSEEVFDALWVKELNRMLELYAKRNGRTRR